MLTRRGFLGALAAAVLAPTAILSALKEAPLQLPIVRNEVLAVTAPVWSNVYTAATLTSKQLQDAIMLLRAMPCDMEGTDRCHCR